MWLRLMETEWVAYIILPLGVRIMMLFCTGFLFWHSVSAQMKYLVHPESAQPTCGGFVLCSSVDEHKLVVIDLASSTTLCHL